MCPWKNFLNLVTGQPSEHAKRVQQTAVPDETAPATNVNPPAAVDNSLTDLSSALQAQAAATTAALTEAKKSSLPALDSEAARRAAEARMRALLANRGVGSTLSGAPTGAAPVGYRALFGS